MTKFQLTKILMLGVLGGSLLVQDTISIPRQATNESFDETNLKQVAHILNGQDPAEPLTVGAVHLSALSAQEWHSELSPMVSAARQNQPAEYSSDRRLLIGQSMANQSSPFVLPKQGNGNEAQSSISADRVKWELDSRFDQNPGLNSRHSANAKEIVDQIDAKADPMKELTPVQPTIAKKRRAKPRFDGLVIVSGLILIVATVIRQPATKWLRQVRRKLKRRLSRGEPGYRYDTSYYNRRSQGW